MSAKILVVEDEAVVALSLCDSLKRLGYDPQGPVSTGEKALKLAEKSLPDLILMDIRIKGDIDGIQTATELGKKYSVPVLYLTAYTDDTTIARAQATEPYGYLVKPYEEKELRSAIEIALYRHRSERRLKKVERWLASTLRSIGDGVIAVDQDLKVTYINPVAEVLTDWPTEDAVGRPVGQILPVFDSQKRPRYPAEEALREGVVVTLDAGHTIKTRTGKSVPIDDSAAPIRNDEGEIVGAVVVFRNVEEHRKLEKRILSVQRLESLGKLSAGIAHDFNNLLTVIQGNLASIKEGYDVEESLEDALEATDRAARIARKLLAFSHPRHNHLVPIDLKVMLDDSIKILNSIVGELHEVVLLPCDRSITVPSDLGMLEQIVTNLVVNGRDAQPDGGRVEISLFTEEREPAAETENQHEWAVIQVQDWGSGISPQELPRIFEPFYTTKSENSGTGLGLASCQGMVRSHGGWIEVESEPGEGTTFRVYLPVLSVAPEKGTGIRGSRDRAATSVLVVEDVTPLRKLLGKILSRAEYRYASTESGEEALDIWQEHGPFHILLTDINIKGEMTGAGLARQMKEENPSLITVFISGYSPEKKDAPFVPDHFLSKPFLPQELLDLLDSIK